MAATVSGSFRRFLTEVQEAVYALTDHGVHVLSPADPRVVDQVGDFLFVASDRLRTIKPVQNRHLAAIAASDLLWLVATDGYVGQSAAMEIGFAAAVGTPIYGLDAPSDLTLKEYVQVVPGIADAIRLSRESRSERSIPSVLLNPEGMIESAHADLEIIERALTRPETDDRDLRSATRRLRRQVIGPLR